MPSESPNHHSKLEETMALLIQNQAAFVGQLADNQRHHLEMQRETQRELAENERRRLEMQHELQRELAENERRRLEMQHELQRELAEAERRRLEMQRESDRLQPENSERFTRIEAQIEQIVRVLAEHTRILERLPVAICEKIGFKATANQEFSAFSTRNGRASM